MAPKALEDVKVLDFCWVAAGPMATKYLSSGEVTSFRDFAFHTYFENPRYLDKIKRRFGLDTVRHIQEMTRHRLKRHHTQF